jgi:hypothetical protein
MSWMQLPLNTANFIPLIEVNRNDWSEWTLDNLEPYDQDLLILDRIRIEPEHRGKNYGLHAAEALIRTLARPCGIVTCTPAPYELLTEARA